MPGTWRFAPEQYEHIGEENANISDTYPKWIDLFGWGTGANPTLHSLDETEYFNFVDWGTNVISNGIVQDGEWRTLSITEWIFFFSYRRQNKYGTGNINGVGGLILLPDDWTLPDGCTFNAYGNSDHEEGDWTHNSYTLEQWARMEAAGAVFLPHAGQRYNRTYSPDYVGNYWSSTLKPNNFASFFSYSSYSFDISGSSGARCYYGLPVRLVQDVD